MKTARTAPWPDYAGTTIHEGDTMTTASGQRGTVEYETHRDDEQLRWRIRFGDHTMALYFQITGKERAVVEKAADA